LRVLERVPFAVQGGGTPRGSCARKAMRAIPLAGLDVRLAGRAVATSACLSGAEVAASV